MHLLENLHSPEKMQQTKILGKTLKELRAMAKELGIKGRSKMSHDVLQRKLWEKIYGDPNFLPNNDFESLEYLMLHPDPMVVAIHRMWMTYGGQSIIEALEVVSKCHATTISQDQKDPTQSPDFKTSQALKDRVKASIALIYPTISQLSTMLSLVEQQYYAERTLENWKGDVLYLVSEKLHISGDRSPYKVSFSESGETRPVAMSGWMLLEPGEKELAKQYIKERWEYSTEHEAYMVCRSDTENLRVYLDVIKTSGETVNT